MRTFATSFAPLAITALLLVAGCPTVDDDASTIPPSGGGSAPPPSGGGGGGGSTEPDPDPDPPEMPDTPVGLLPTALQILTPDGTAVSDLFAIQAGAFELTLVSLTDVTGQNLTDPFTTNLNGQIQIIFSSVSNGAVALTFSDALAATGTTTSLIETSVGQPAIGSVTEAQLALSGGQIELLVSVGSEQLDFFGPVNFPLTATIAFVQE